MGGEVGAATGDGPDTHPPRKLYAVVREDLPPGLRAAQMAHAVAGVVQNMPLSTLKWQTTDNYLIVLGVPGEADLRRVAGVLLGENVSHYLWHEPDLGDALTAIASFPPPEKNHLFEDLPLAYSKRWRSLWRRIVNKF